MSRNWAKYINQNKYSECQLITALNAYYCLTGKVYCKQDSREYEDLVDLVGARHGAAICVEKAYKILGIEIVWQGIDLSDFGDSIPLPVEYSVWSNGYGFHSTLIVDHVKKCNAYRITNFEKATSSDGWLLGKEMYKYECFCDKRNYDTYALFGLKGDKKNDNIKRRWKRDRKRFFNNYRLCYEEKCQEVGLL